MAGVLYLVATPIGNLEDITLRALRVLREEVSAIACEDTRQTQKLLDHFEIRKQLLSYHEHNEASRAAEIVERLLVAGDSIAIVTDAGTPLISDPGYRVVVAAIEAGLTVVPLPGASAVLTALAASGLAVDQFRFLGFLPPKTHARCQAFEALRFEPSTIIAYESPHRILESLHDLGDVLGARRVVLGRELTKLHEEFLRGTAAEIQAQLASRPSIKGEMTLVISGASEQRVEGDPKEIVARLEQRGLDRMEAIKAAAKQMGLPKRAVYQAVAGPDNNSPGKRHG